jgi:glyoxylase-like metal-dependent hydrolase (beta-lactamase superfamily II)
VARTFFILLLIWGSLWAVESFQVGSVTLFAVKDLDTNMGSAILLNKEGVSGSNQSSINAFLIVSGETAVLIDTGMNGELQTNLKEIGYETDAIRQIVITHMHNDHIGGLISEGRKNFSNAMVYLPENDLRFWRNSTPENKRAAEELKSVYGENLKTYGWGDQIFPFLQAVRADGHTPGHSAFLISSEGEKLLIVSDLIHFLAVQMADPTRAVVFDVDPQTAVSTRVRLLNLAANTKIPIAGMHIPYPGIGRVAKAVNGGFIFIPEGS